MSGPETRSARNAARISEEIVAAAQELNPEVFSYWPSGPERQAKMRNELGKTAQAAVEHVFNYAEGQATSMVPEIVGELERFGESLREAQIMEEGEA